MASGNILVFLTQDALPVSKDFIARLIEPIDGRVTAAAYARQIPGPEATPTEAFARLYNYPPESSSRHISSVHRRTLKTFFFSNAARPLTGPALRRWGDFLLLCQRMKICCCVPG